jgi:hypothetical protein
MSDFNMIKPTHRCNICGSYWRLWADSWSLTSHECGECCDQAEMGEQIVKLIDYDENDQEIINV